MKRTIAAHIPTYNCPEEFKKCVNAIRWVDEIIVADNSSNDDIKNICKNLQWPNIKYNHYDESDIRKRLMLSLPMIESDFILWVHSDEYYSTEAEIEIRSALQAESLPDGFIIPSESYVYKEYFGKGISQLRLFRKNAFQFKFESIHEMPIVEGRTILLKHGYDHYNSPTFYSQVGKVFLYAENDAKTFSDQQLNKLRKDKLNMVSLKFNFVYFFIRMLYRYRKVVFSRKVTFVHLWFFYLEIMTMIANSVAATEEIRKRESK